VFSLVLFSAGLTGTSFMRLVMSGVIVFLPFALYVLIVYSVSYGFSNMYESFYFDFDRLKFYFPFLRIINDFTTIAEGEHVFGTELLMLPEIALFYVGGLFLHKYRRSESSGTTIIWKPVFMVVRCILIFTAGLLGMMLFGSGIFGGSSLINFIFGAAVGLILSFMLVNSVLYRSSKSMFKGARSFVLIVLLTIVFIFFVPLNITGMIGTPYSPSNTGKIEIDIGSIDITIEDPNEVKTIAALINDEYYSFETARQFPD